MTRYSKLWLAAFSLSTVAFAGCTNDEDLGGRSPHSVGPRTTEAEYCANAADSRDCARGDQAQPEGPKICREHYACLVGLLESDAADAFLGCQKADVCGQTSHCKTLMAQKAPLHVAESQKCYSRYVECRDGSTGKEPFDDDLCEYVIGMKADVLAEYAPCFERACGEVQGCLQSVLASRGLNDCPQ